MSFDHYFDNHTSRIELARLEAKQKSLVAQAERLLPERAIEAIQRYIEANDTDGWWEVEHSSRILYGYDLWFHQGEIRLDSFPKGLTLYCPLAAEEICGDRIVRWTMPFFFPGEIVLW